MVRAAALIVALLASPTLAAVPDTAPAVRIFPEVGVETEVELGQPMVFRESLVTATSLRLVAPVKSDKYSLGVRISLQPGVYHLDHADKRGRYFAPPGMTTVGPNAHWPVEGIFVPAEGDGAPMAYMEALLATARVKAPDMKVEAADQSGFRRELIYSGTAQGVVNISYREFNNDLARPAFTQDLKYDLKEGDEVGFRGARLKILKAGNVSIRYVVLKPLDTPSP